MVCTYVDGTYTLNAAQKKQTSQYPSVYKVPNSQLSDACGLGQTLWYAMCDWVRCFGRHGQLRLFSSTKEREKGHWEHTLVQLSLMQEHVYKVSF